MTSGPISRTGMRLAAGASVAFVVTVALRASGAADTVISTVTALVLTAPLWVVASMLGATVSLDEAGATRRGLLRSTSIAWSEVRGIDAGAGLYGQRRLTLRGARTRIAMSSPMPGFAEAARAVLAEADGGGSTSRFRREWGASDG